MAAAAAGSVSSFSFLDKKSSKKQNDKCLCCEELRLDLQKAKMEILSSEEIVKVLHDEFSNNKSDSTKQKIFCGEQSKVQTSKDDWIQVLTKMNKKYEDFNSSLVQIIPYTANKFELLSNLKVDESTSTPITAEKTSNISSFQKTRRKTHLVKSVNKEMHKV